MKTHTQDYIDQEEARKRKPRELYHIWRDGGEHWRYTSFTSVLNYGGNDFTPALIDRGTAKYDAKFEVTTLGINFGYLNDPVVEYIAQNPVELLWVEVLRYFEDVTPEEVSVIFIGQIKDVTFQGNLAKANCVGFEHYLKQRIPKFRWQIGCNNDLFDTFCSGLDMDTPDGPQAADYKVTTTITNVDEEGVDLASTDFGLKDDGYFTRGYVKWGDYYRMIVDHTGDTITIRFSMPGFAAGQSIDAYPGCDRQLLTCRDKFNNVNNFFGHPWIPLDNPSQWY